MIRRAARRRARVDAAVAAHQLASIPGIFPPVAIGEQRLIDGGVVNNTPTSHAVELGAERIYILPTQEPHSRSAIADARAATRTALQRSPRRAHLRLVS